MRTLALVVPLLLSLAFFAPAQALSATPQLTFDTTERVRVEAPTVDPIPITGSFLGATGDTLIVAAPGENYFIPIAEVIRFEKSFGSRSSLTAGALVGLTAGLVVGAVIGSSGDTGPADDYGTSQGISTAGVAVVGALVGAAIGGAIGSNMKSEVWTRIPLDDLRLQIRAHEAVNEAEKVRASAAGAAEENGSSDAGSSGRAQADSSASD